MEESERRAGFSNFRFQPSGSKDWAEERRVLHGRNSKQRMNAGTIAQGDEDELTVDTRNTGAKGRRRWLETLRCGTLQSHTPMREDEHLQMREERRMNTSTRILENKMKQE